MTSSASHHSTDEPLISLIVAGDRRAFSALVRMYAPLLVGYAARILRSGDLAEDIVQEVLTRVWDHRGALAQCESVRAYLLRAVRNAALNALRHRQAEDRWEAAYLLEELPPGMGIPAEDAEEHIVRRELSDALLRAIDRLPERRRQIILLRLQQLSYSEIAQILEISPKTIEAQVTQAFATLRETLGPWFE
jgi:RNA polymerase sigma-70 factor (ECF subfamily)